MEDNDEQTEKLQRRIQARRAVPAGKQRENDAQIERELGISQSLLGKWKQRYRVGSDKDSPEPRLERSELEEVKAENRRLKRELAIAQEEREILKKAVSIFSDKRA